MIHWSTLESLVDCLDEIWCGTETGQRRSQELRAIAELGRCDLATAPALCFFSGRMVEDFVSDEWDRFLVTNQFSRLNQRQNLDEQINHLQQFGLLSDLSAACIHEVRKLGNRARHQAHFPSMIQATFCLAMIKKLLPLMARGWCEEVLRVCSLHQVTVFDEEVSWLLSDGSLANNLIGFRDLLRLAPNLLYALRRADSSFPTEVTNWVTQQCIDANRLDLAGELISRFVENGDPDQPQLYPDRDGRFRVSHFNRLIALRLSRLGKSEAAIDFLTDLAKRARYLAENGDPMPLQSSGSHSYAESLGILAGAYKTRWMKQHGAADLACMTRLYKCALKAEPWNSYLAINAAASSAWSNDRVFAHDLCLGLLQRLEPALRQNSQSFWNLLTTAEAFLICGHHVRALECYGQANEIFGSIHAGDIKRARAQANIHARYGLIDSDVNAKIVRALSQPDLDA